MGLEWKHRVQNVCDDTLSARRRVTRIKPFRHERSVLGVRGETAFGVGDRRFGIDGSGAFLNEPLGGGVQLPGWKKTDSLPPPLKGLGWPGPKFQNKNFVGIKQRTEKNP